MRTASIAYTAPGTDGEGDYTPPANATHHMVIVGDLPDAPSTLVNQTLDMKTLQIRMDGVNNWIDANDPDMNKYNYNNIFASYRDNFNAIVQNNAAVAPDQRQLSLVAGVGLVIMMAPTALVGLDALGLAGAGGAGAAADGGLEVQFGANANQTFHTFRHVVDAGLDVGEVSDTVAADIQANSTNIVSGQKFSKYSPSFWAELGIYRL